MSMNLDEDRINTFEETIIGSINTDGRQQYEWETKYTLKACEEMRLEAIYIVVILVIALLGVYGSCIHLYNDTGACSTDSNNVSINMLCYFFSGLLGGIIFGIKYFYRVIARGYWSQDRRFWRIFSPWVSAVIAIIVGCMVEAGFINSAKTSSIYLIICFGFFSGYFADEAVGKMSEVANALFGNSTRTK